MDSALKSRVLMKDGAWLVPPDERPRGWERMGIAEPAPQVREPAPQPQPTDIEVATAVGQVAEATRAAESPSEKPVRPKAKNTPPYKPPYKTWPRFERAIRRSAKVFGANPNLTGAALVMFAGMWTRDQRELSELVGVSRSQVKQWVQALKAAKIWKDGSMGIELGDIDTECGDMELWLRAMVVDGELTTSLDKNGKRLFGVYPIPSGRS